MNHALVIPLTLIVTLSLAAAGSSAQAALVATSLETEVSAPNAAAWDGSSTTGQVAVSLCYAEGAFNPAGGQFLLTATVSAPGWVQAEVAPAEATITPPTGPAAEAGCEQVASFAVTVRAAGELQYGGAAQIGLEIAASEVPEETTGVGTAGTYTVPGGTSASFSLTAMERPQEGEGGPETTGGPDAPQDPSTGESPAPGLAMVLVGLAAIAALRRRR